MIHNGMHVRSELRTKDEQDDCHAMICIETSSCCSNDCQAGLCDEALKFVHVVPFVRLGIFKSVFYCNKGK